MRIRLLGISLGAVALSLTASAGLAGCGTNPANRPHLAQVTAGPRRGGTLPNGLVTGRYLMEGGAMDPETGHTANPWPIDGQVTFTSSGRTASAAAGPNGEFSIRLDPGTYAVTASTSRLAAPGQSESGCALPQTVTVHAGEAASITVYCPVP